ncbi:hypothetical protein HanIR_Chr11g0525051 [Helianthus annuus]|nr:hypothetical protein HanIR_Chr11g0525051 [Helianthus annuus]
MDFDFFRYLSFLIFQMHHKVVKYTTCMTFFILVLGVLLFMISNIFKRLNPTPFCYIDPDRLQTCKLATII